MWLVPAANVCKCYEMDRGRMIRVNSAQLEQYLNNRKGTKRVGRKTQRTDPPSTKKIQERVRQLEKDLREAWAENTRLQCRVNQLEENDERKA